MITIVKCCKLIISFIFLLNYHNYNNRGDGGTYDGATGAMVVQVRWCYRGDGGTGTMVLQVRWWYWYDGATGAMVLQMRWCHRCDGATSAMVL